MLSVGEQTLVLWKSGRQSITSKCDSALFTRSGTIERSGNNNQYKPSKSKSVIVGKSAIQSTK